jgi:hypothetical protein
VKHDDDDGEHDAVNYNLIGVSPVKEKCIRISYYLKKN